MYDLVYVVGTLTIVQDPTKINENHSHAESRDQSTTAVLYGKKNERASFAEGLPPSPARFGCRTDTGDYL